MFLTGQPKLLIAGAILFAVLCVVGSYFGSHWYYGDVTPVPEHLLSVEPLPQKVNQQTFVCGSRDTESLDWGSVSEEEKSFGDEVVSTTVPDNIEDELLVLLEDEAPLPDETGDFPKVPDGFPSDLTPVWIEFPNYQKGDMYTHEMIYRVLIKLWNQGDHDFVNGVYQDDNDRVYPLYRDVVYIEWGETASEDPDEEVVRFPRYTLATHAREPGAMGELFTVEELTSGAYKTKYPNVTFIDYDSAGYDPETFLDDY